MTRQEHLNFCRQCTHRDFDSKKGIICSLTSEIASFETNCENYNKDSAVELKANSENEEEVVLPVSALPEVVLKKLKSHQDISYALIGGLLGAVVSAVIWAVITVTFEYQIAYMAIGVGFLVGFTVRFFGAGVDKIYGIIGASFALFGCLLGNLLSQVGFYAQTESLGYFQLISLLNPEIIISIFEGTFSPIDLLFYGFAVFQGYKMSFRPIDKSFLNSDVSDSILKPSYTNLRLPLTFMCLVFFSVVIYQVRQGGNGPRTFYYESGKLMSEGEFINNKEHGKWNFYNEDGALNFVGFYKNGISDSTWQWFDETNKMVRTGSYKAGLPHGTWMNYYPSGSISDSGSYVSGRKEGDWVYYHENGAVSQKGAYKRDYMEGQWETFFDNGNLSSEGKYDNNTLSGLWKYYSKTGQLNEEMDYLENEEVKIINAWNHKTQIVKDGSGEFISFFDNGKIMLKGTVVDGKKSGLWTMFYENGNKKEEGFYEGDIYKIVNSWDSEANKNVINENGEYVSFLENGIIYEKGQIENGLRTGSWEVYFPESGNLFQENNYVNGVLDGDLITYYESGAIYSEGLMKNDKKEGQWNWYYEYGSVESTVNYKNDKKEGLQSFYSESGDKLKEEYYSSGEFLGEELLVK